MVCLEVMDEVVVLAVPVDAVVLVREGVDIRQEEVGMPDNADVAGHVGVVKEPNPTVSVHIYPSSR